MQITIPHVIYKKERNGKNQNKRRRLASSKYFIHLLATINLQNYIMVYLNIFQRYLE